MLARAAFVDEGGDGVRAERSTGLQWHRNYAFGRFRPPGFAALAFAFTRFILAGTAFWPLLALFA